MASGPELYVYEGNVGRSQNASTKESRDGTSGGELHQNTKPTSRATDDHNIRVPPCCLASVYIGVHMHTCILNLHRYPKISVGIGS